MGHGRRLHSPVALPRAPLGVTRGRGGASPHFSYVDRPAHRCRHELSRVVRFSPSARDCLSGRASTLRILLVDGGHQYLQWRIPEAGFDVTRATEAVVWHSAVRRGATKPGWKYYYETRNAVYYRLHIQRGQGRRFYRLARVLARTPFRILLQEDRKVAKLALFVRGAFDGLVGRLGIRVPADEKTRTYDNWRPQTIEKSTTPTHPIGQGNQHGKGVGGE